MTSNSLLQADIEKGNSIEGCDAENYGGKEREKRNILETKE